MVRTVSSDMGARVPIDLNDRTRDALTRARLEDVTGAVTIGARITAYEPEDGVAADARVVEIDEEKQLVVLAVDWSTLRDDGVARGTPMAVAKPLVAPPPC